MKPSSLLQSLLFFTTNVSAIPAAARRRSPAHYSVVNVDGNNNSPSPAIPATIIQTSFATSTATLISTLNPTPLQPSPAETVYLTQTDAVPVTISVSASPTTIIAAPSVTSYYDNGLWHTYYPIHNFGPDWSGPESSSSLSLETLAPSSPTSPLLVPSVTTATETATAIVNATVTATPTPASTDADVPATVADAVAALDE